MPFVLDASVTACWAFDDEAHFHASLALERLRADIALVPTVWWFEVRNTLVVNDRGGRLSEADTASFLRAVSRLPLVVDRAPNEERVLALARAHRLSVYDAAYLELAKREGVPLATLDRMLQQAARAENLSLLGDVP